MLVGMIFIYFDTFAVNPLKTELFLNNVKKFSSYLTGNTSRLRYKEQPVNAV
jgi:hypothetical protein